MTALWLALGFLGGRVLRQVLDHPTTKPGRPIRHARRRERSAL